jgi:hypothetical protein
VAIGGTFFPFSIRDKYAFPNPAWAASSSSVRPAASLISLSRRPSPLTSECRSRVPASAGVFGDARPTFIQRIMGSVLVLPGLNGRAAAALQRTRDSAEEAPESRFDYWSRAFASRTTANPYTRAHKRASRAARDPLASARMAARGGTSPGERRRFTFLKVATLRPLEGARNIG